MEGPVIRKLFTINREFYQTFAASFAATRSRLQPGVIKILNQVPLQSNILDLGSGNGELARWLFSKGYRGVYLGLDFSLALLEIARDNLQMNAQGYLGKSDQGEGAGPNSFTFLQADLTSQSWDRKVHESVKKTFNIDGFDLVFAFATLHHLPGKEIQIHTLQKIRNFLKDHGRLIQSNWQFLNSKRLRKRIQPWQAVEMSVEDVDEGDYLLDWRQGGYGLRYVHHFGEDELYDLAATTGFKVVKSFYSDGKEGNLGLYQVWEKNP